MNRARGRNPWPKEQRCENCDENKKEVYVSFANIGTGVLLDKAEYCIVCATRAAEKLGLTIGKGF